MAALSEYMPRITSKHCYICTTVEDIIRKIIANGAFEWNGPLNDIKVTHIKQLCFSNLFFEVLVTGAVNYLFVVKRPRDHELLPNMVFQHEQLFYNMLVPHLGDQKDLVPRTYAVEDSISYEMNSFVIMENLFVLGYKPLYNQWNEVHMLLTVKSLALLHDRILELQRSQCLSYKQFFTTIAKTHSWTYHYKDKLLKKLKFFKKKALVVTKLNYYFLSKLMKKLRKMKHEIFDIMDLVNVQNNDFLTIIHGRLVRSKVMFKYNTHNVPESIKIIGWQAVSIGSPAIDFGRIVFANIPTENDCVKIKWYFYNMINAYLDARNLNKQHYYSFTMNEIIPIKKTISVKMEKDKEIDHCYGCSVLLNVINMLSSSCHTLKFFKRGEKCMHLDITHSEQPSSLSIFFNVTMYMKHKAHSRIISLLVKLPRDHEFMSFEEKQETVFYGMFVHCMKPSYAVECYTIINNCKITKQPLLIMADLAKCGYSQPKGNKLDLTHLETCMRTLAKFHADTYNMQRSYPIHYKDTINHLNKLKKKKHKYINNTDKMIMLKSFWKSFITYSDINEFLKQKIYKKIDEMIDYRKDNFRTIIHGRFIKSKMMFQYNSFKQPIDVKIIGWQAMTVGSPGKDFARMLLSNLPDESDASKLTVFSRRMLKVYMKTLEKKYPYLREQTSFEQNIIHNLAFVFLNHFMTMENYLSVLHMINKLGGFDLDNSYVTDNSGLNNCRGLSHKFVKHQ